MTTKQVIRALESQRKALAKTSDELRGLQDEIDEQCSDAIEALESLECCIELLSRQV